MIKKYTYEEVLEQKQQISKLNEELRKVENSKWIRIEYLDNIFLDYKINRFPIKLI